MSQPNGDPIENAPATETANLAPAEEASVAVEVEPAAAKGEAAAEDKESKKANDEEKTTWWGYIKKFCKRWFIQAFSGMAMGLFCTLIAGLILKQIGSLILSFWPGAGIGLFFTRVGQVASVLTGAGIGAGVAHALNAPRLVIFCAVVTGLIGGNANAFAAGNFPDATNKVILGGPGDPISAYLASIVCTEVGIWISGTPVDILLVPLVTLSVGSVVGQYLGPPISSFLAAVGRAVQSATTLQPVLMGIVVSAVMGVLLTLPTSSAAIGIAIQLQGISAGAATAGCASHMIGFAVASFRDNGISGLISQGIGTSMLQIPNVMRRPLVLIPAVAASVVAGPLSSAAFKLLCNKEGSGMGTSGFVGVIMTWTTSREAGLPTARIVWGILVCHFLVPALVSWAVAEGMRKMKWLREGDMKIATK